MNKCNRWSLNCGQGAKQLARKGARKEIRTQALLRRGNGFKVSWEQTDAEVWIRIPVPHEVTKKEISLKLLPFSLDVSIAGTPVIGGSLRDVGEIIRDECYWNVLQTAEGKVLQISLVKAEPSWDYMWETILEDEGISREATEYAWMSITSNGQFLGKFFIKLFGNLAPKAVQNFSALCSGEHYDEETGELLTYKGTRFFKTPTGLGAYGGDIENNDGTGGKSIYGKYFEDENFVVKHEGPGMLAMANTGPHTNNSQFYITFCEIPRLDYKSVVFGQLEMGLQWLYRIQKAGNIDGTPGALFEISDCGVVSDSKAGKLMNQLIQEEKERSGQPDIMKQDREELRNLRSLGMMTCSKSDLEQKIEVEGLGGSGYIPLGHNTSAKKMTKDFQRQFMQQPKTQKGEQSEQSEKKEEARSS